MMTLELISQLETELAVERAEKAVLQASNEHVRRQMEQVLASLITLHQATTYVA